MADVSMPKKSLHRQRAHCNPLSDGPLSYPISPDHVDWSLHFPEIGDRKESPMALNTFDHPITYSLRQPDEVNGRKCKQVSMIDVGCGYGGLTVALAELFPDRLILGLEIREKVTEYVGKRIRALREQHPSRYGNCAVMRQNAMKFLPNYIRKGQLRALFFCFPDPHFKTKNWRRRIVNYPLLSLYSYCLAEGGRIYTITDVDDLHEWMVTSIESHPHFRRVQDDESDPVVMAVRNSTEEGQKVARNAGHTSLAIYERVTCSD